MYYRGQNQCMVDRSFHEPWTFSPDKNFSRESLDRIFPGELNTILFMVEQELWEFKNG